MTQFFLHSAQRVEPAGKYVPGLSLANVLYAIWPLIFSLVILLLLDMMGSWLANGARGYIMGESIWSKSRHEASDSLRRYVLGGDSSDYARFQAQLAIPLGDRRAREALQQQPPDKETARAGFITGGNNPDDINAMIWLFLNAQFHPSIKGAIAAWTAGDAGIEDLVRIGKQAYALHSAGDAPPDVLNALAGEASAVSARLVKLEHSFSTEIAKAARDMSVWLTRLDIAAAGMLLVMGFVITRRMLMQRHVAKAAARRSAERLELATLGANDGIWEWQLGSREMFWTPRVPELLGFPPAADFTQYVLRENIHPQDREKFDLGLKEHLAGMTQRLQLDLQFRCYDGNYRWFRMRGMAMRDALNNPTRLLGTLSDINANVIAEQALREAWRESRLIAGELELALNGADVALWAFDPATGNILHHKRWDALLGRKSMPRTFNGWVQLTHPDDRAQRLRLLQDHLEARTAYYESEFRMQHEDGTWVWVRSRGRATVRDQQGKAMQYAGAVMNITVQVAAREVQRREQDFLRAMIEGVDLGVMISNFDQVVYANRSLARLLGYENESALTGEPLTRILASSERAADLANRERAVQGTVIPVRVVRLKTHMQTRIKVVMNLSCVDWNGTPHFISTITPLTEHSELEVHLRSAADRFERAMLSELEAQQAMIARELHDSLGSILAGISLLLSAAQRPLPPERLSELMERTQEQVRTAAEMTRALAHGIMPVGSSPGAFRQALEQFAHNLTETKGLCCTVHASDDFDAVQPDVGNHVYRIMQEATTNAIRHGKATEIQIILQASDTHYSMAVSDNGRGMDVHSSTQPSGMGLQSMRTRARAIGAVIELLHNPQGGCDVLLKWPVSPRGVLNDEVDQENTVL
jgi:PAS domain S-box-containing protein